MRLKRVGTFRNGGVYGMKQFTLELNKNVQRPVAKLADWHQCTKYFYDFLNR
jgi:hypothetical protein